MILIPFVFLLGFFRRAVGRRRQIHPIPKERGDDNSPEDGVSIGNGCKMNKSPLTVPESANEHATEICKCKSSLSLLDDEKNLPASHDQSVISKKQGILPAAKVVRSPSQSKPTNIVVDASLSVVSRRMDIFWSDKSLIEREFYTHEFDSEIGSRENSWKVLHRQLEASLVFADPELELHYDVECQDRNRYRNILPYKQSRVKLLNTKNDYINASFVSVEEVSRNYIVTQGPMENTTDHFWQMIWEQQSVGIVMLCKCEERGRKKCAHYWPTVGDSPVMTGRYVVECTTCESKDSYTISSLKLEYLETEESRMILHFHYFSWPDFGVPQNPMVFLDFLMDVRESGVMQPGVGPVVVHCSAGIGRSGVFSLTDVCVSWLEGARSLNTLDLKYLLLHMRKQRLGLIQTPEQLRFSYITVLNAAYYALGLGQTIPDLKKEVESFKESLKDDAEMEHSRPKLVYVFPAPEEASAHALPPPPLPPPPCSPSLPVPPSRSPSGSPTLSSLYSIESYSSDTGFSLSSPTPAPLLFPHSISSSSLSPHLCTSPVPRSVNTSLHVTRTSTRLPADTVVSNSVSVLETKTKVKRNWFKRLKQRLFQRKRRSQRVTMMTG